MNPRARFHQRARKAIADQDLQAALDYNTMLDKINLDAAYASHPDIDSARTRARAIREDVLANLDKILDQFTARVEEHGIKVHHAHDALQARTMIRALLQENGAQLIVKSKSMVTEEIALNPELESHGMQVWETDLGEFIVQLREEKPSHIIAPATHLHKGQVAEVFQRKLGMAPTDDIRIMNDTARSTLREKFLHADAGISGVNFGVADTGALCLVTNEGNGRMVTCLPPLHIAVMGIERLVPDWDALALMLQLLPRAGTGQAITSYVSLLHSPRREADPDGAQERHLVLVDNGRRALQQSSMSDSLLCIRCGACLNVCPVYQELGGHAYDSVYPGPIGSLISPAIFGVEAYGHLSKASTLCGACAEVCPVRIDIPKLLLRGRETYVKAVTQPLWLRGMMKVFAWFMGAGWRYSLALKLASLGTRLLPRRENWVTWLPAQLSAWTQSRHFPAFSSSPFRSRLKNAAPSIQVLWGAQAAEPGLKTGAQAQFEESPLERLTREIHALGGEIICTNLDSVAELVLQKLQSENLGKALIWGADAKGLREVRDVLLAAGMDLLAPLLPDEPDERRRELKRLAEYGVGITGASAAFADTGTLVLPAGPGRAGLVSLLPLMHLAILDSDSVYRTMEDWLKRSAGADLADAPYTTLISGPSRTADIESTLTLGVHGPRFLHVYCIVS